MIKALEARAGLPDVQSPQITAEHLVALQQRLREAGRLFEAVRREAEEGIYHFDSLVETALQTAAADLAAAWRSDGVTSVQVSEVVDAALLRVLGNASSRLIRPLDQLRAELADVLRQASEAFPSGRELREDLPKPANLPLFDPAMLTGSLRLQRPRILPLFGQTLLQRSVRAALLEPLEKPLQDQLGIHRNRLRDWLHQFLAGLQAAYGARAEIYRAQFDNPSGTFSRVGNAADIERDLRCLRKLTESPHDVDHNLQKRDKLCLNDRFVSSFHH